MSRLEELIIELCPDGVEYLPIGELARYEQPGKYIVNSTDYNDDFEVPVLTAGQSFILGYTNEKEGVYPATKESPVIIFDDFTGAFKWVDFPFKVKSSAMKMLKAKDDVTFLRYIFYVMGWLNYSSSEHKRLWISIYSELKVPVPPIEVQHEIVRILDNFTELTSQLIEKLSSELNDRRTQFEYYTEQLIKTSCEKEVKLSDIVDIFLGLTATPKYTDRGIKFISAQNTSSDFLDLENVKYISWEDFTKASNNAKPKKGDLLFTRVGSNLGHPVIVNTDEDLCIFVSLGFLRIKKDVPLRIDFLKHWMNTDLFWGQVRKNVHGAAKVNLNTGWLKDFVVPFPSLDIQNRIVSQLNELEDLNKKITANLSFEIEKRKKQYAYYRELVLNFKEKFS